MVRTWNKKNYRLPLGSLVIYRVIKLKIYHLIEDFQFRQMTHREALRPYG